MSAERKNQNHRLLRYSVAVLSVAIALGLALLLAPWLDSTIIPLFFIAVMVSAWCGGWEAGVLATLLSILAIRYCLIQPLYSLQVVNVETIVQLGIFAIAAGLISWLSQSRQRALTDARANYQILQETLEREATARTRSRQMEGELQQSEARFHALTANLPQGAVFVVDRDLRYLLAEGKALAEVGMTSEDFVGKTIWETLDSNLVASYEPNYRQALSGKPFSHEHNSHNHHYISHGTPLYTDQGEIYAVLAMSYDISDRKRREADQDLLAEITNGLVGLENIEKTMEQLGATIGQHFDVKYCMFAEHADEIETAIAAYGWNDVDVPPIAGTYRMRDFLAEAELAAILTGEPLIVSDTQTDVRVSAESYGALNIHSFMIVPLLRDCQWQFQLSIIDNKPRTWQGNEIELMRELTTRIWAHLERARAEEAVVADLRDTQLLRELGARMATEGDIQALYQEIISVAIALTHADAGTVQILDKTTQELVLLSTQGFDRTMTDHFYRVDASSDTSCGIALCNGERTFVDFDVPESEDPHGSMRLHVAAGYLSAQSTPLISRSGRAIGMVSTHWCNHSRPSDRELRFLDLLARQAADLIEQRQTEAEREHILAREQAARAEADRANHVKDEFLAVLSHELRSPLNLILGWAKLLRQGRLDATKTGEALQTIERNAQLQSELIEDLLDVSRILQGKLCLNVSPVNLATVIRSAMETVHLAAQAKSIPVEADLNSAVGTVLGDATRLQQVVWNLLSNAVKFTPAGSRVEVELSLVTGHSSWVAEEQPQINDQEPITQSAQITVRDTGKGIVPEFLPRVFDYFQQEDGATTRKFGGLGLGLAIVRQIVELHGGTVWAESQGEGQGATFTVRLPLMPIQRSSDPEPDFSSLGSVDLTGIQVLVVDDETDSRDFTAFVVKQTGASVRTAASAAEAIALLTQFQIDVLLSDIGMPDMDGYMLIQQVRGLPPEQNGRIKAIALTAYAGDFNQQHALQAGFQQHVSKPVEPDKLVTAITSLVMQRE